MPIGPRYVTYLAPQIRRCDARRWPKPAEIAHRLTGHPPAFGTREEPGPPGHHEAIFIEQMCEVSHPASLALDVRLRKGIRETDRFSCECAAQWPGYGVSRLLSMDPGRSWPLFEELCTVSTERKSIDPGPADRSTV